MVLVLVFKPGINYNGYCRSPSKATILFRLVSILFFFDVFHVLAFEIEFYLYRLSINVFIISFNKVYAFQFAIL
jgi:hypothetical protein